MNSMKTAAILVFCVTTVACNTFLAAQESPYADGFSPPVPSSTAPTIDLKRNEQGFLVRSEKSHEEAAARVQDYSASETTHCCGIAATMASRRAACGNLSFVDRKESYMKMASEFPALLSGLVVSQNHRFQQSMPSRPTCCPRCARSPGRRRQTFRWMGLTLCHY